MNLKYTKLVIDRSRFAAGQYDINLANEAELEVAATQARIKKLEHLEAIAQDVNTWLISKGMAGTAHQLQLEAALKGE